VKNLISGARVFVARRVEHHLVRAIATPFVSLAGGEGFGALPRLRRACHIGAAASFALAGVALGLIAPEGP